MKVKVDGEDAPPFKPIELVVTFESQEEVEKFLASFLGRERENSSIVRALERKGFRPSWR